MSETKRYGSIEGLCEKILLEAEEYKKELLEKTKSDAASLSAEYDKKAKEAADNILLRANEKAKEAYRAAESAAEMRARNTRLAIKAELLEAAYQKAEEKIASLTRSETLSFFAPYLEEILATKPSGKARLFVGYASPVSADELYVAAKTPSDVEIGGVKESFASGFCLETDTLSFDCSAHTLIESIRFETEKDVLRLLFEE